MYLYIFLCSVLISSISQVLLKSSAGEQHQNALRQYLNVKVILAYGMFFVATLITILAYRTVPLSMGGILEASGYIFVTAFSRIFLKEKVGKRKLVGLFFILGGILIFNL